MHPEPALHVALHQPEIPGNTGSVGRLCVALGLRLHVVHPIGFSMDDRAVRRAGLDYWRHVDLQEHADDAAFWAWAEGRRVHLFAAGGDRPYTQATFEGGDVLLFGKETVGLPRDWVERHGALRLPMVPGPIRSLNLANAASVVAYHAMTRIRPDLFAAPAGEAGT